MVDERDRARIRSEVQPRGGAEPLEHSATRVSIDIFLLVRPLARVAPVRLDHVLPAVVIEVDRDDAPAPSAVGAAARERQGDYARRR